ncbi:MAG: prepilin-type N-terminal cleavage/methylation domain-containing protein [Rickettsiales bacterium]|jgi:prepilin-type N-terminal cleavage/methylation domain-containing protein|nr:prepilin-type N-terminal cleavage/methylation domain-containing protein [Rickettsiales bacterium]
MTRPITNKKQNIANKAFTLVEFSIVITIIALLLAVVSTSRILINKAKLQKAQLATKSAPILGITNDKGDISARLWLEASNPNSYKILSDDTVEIWYDKTPYDNDISNGTDSAYLPIILKNAINGYGAALYFDGNDQLFSDGKTPLAFGDDDYSIIAVWQTEKIVNHQVIWAQNAAETASGVTDHVRGSLILSIGGYGFSGENSDRRYMATYAIDTPYISILIKNDLVIDLYHLGTANSDVISSDTNLYTERHSVGRKASINSEYFTGYIAEIIVFDKALNDSEIDELHNYLFSKYGLNRP